jgi:hypothetical protein
MLMFLVKYIVVPLYMNLFFKPDYTSQFYGFYGLTAWKVSWRLKFGFVSLNKVRNNRPTFVLWRQTPKYFENWALLGYYAASSGNLLPTFQDNLLVRSFFFFFLFLNTDDGTDRFPETSIRTHKYSLHNNPEERRSHVRSTSRWKRDITQNSKNFNYWNNKSSNTCNIVYYFKFSRRPKFKYSGFIHECILIT